MYIHGSFINKKGTQITVHIVTGGDTTETMQIGTEGAGVWFTDDPVEITNEVNDTFDHLLRRSATIRLLSRNMLSDLFAVSCRDNIVNIYSGSTCLFAGFVSPRVYNQPYNEVLDELEISCVDALSALQYSKYMEVGTLGVLYGLTKASADQRTFYTIATEILDGVTEDLDILGTQTVSYLYDGSKAINTDNANRYTIFSQIAVSDLLFLGDSEDDVWTQDEVLEELLRYLNLHIIQDGFTFYIFSWETVHSSSTISWRDIVSSQTASTTRRTVQISMENVADVDANVSICDVYNQVALTCKTEEMDNVIESPLDSDLLDSPYVTMQKYCTEYSSEGEGVRAIKGIWAMIHDNATDYKEASWTDWFIRVKSNPSWTFPMAGDQTTDLVDYFCSGGINQHALPNYLGGNAGATIIAMGSVKTKAFQDDNSPVSRVDLTDYLVIGVNGNEVDNDESNTYPGVNDIKARIPYAVYTGSSAGGVFSPADDDIINYIVVSGSMVLNPVMHMTATYADMRSASAFIWSEQTVPSRNNDDGRYYTRKYWKALNPTDTAEWDSSTSYGLTPFSNEGPQLYEFKYSAIGERTDTISKVAVIACMLVIGDKCVVETGTRGQVTDFEWRTYKPLSECADEDEYYAQSFTIGFDPKIGDKLIGTEFSIQNNISYTMAIDAEGTAIPIRKSDHVSGQVHFMILGPVNTTWGEVTRRHPTFFRHTSWSVNSKPLLAHVSSILIKDFEVKCYSDNALTDLLGDNELVYMSDTDEQFVNVKDDLEFSICSALTASECVELGVHNGINLSTPVDQTTNNGVLSIHDYGKAESGKPEKLYVDSYWKEYHKPRIILEQSLEDTGATVGLFDHYTHPALGKTFFVQGVSRYLMDGTARLILKELDD